jgi:hypothetical protein
MRRVLPLLALLPLAFAPAPFPKTRTPPATPAEKLREAFGADSAAASAKVLFEARSGSGQYAYVFAADELSFADGRAKAAPARYAIFIRQDGKFRLFFKWSTAEPALLPFDRDVAAVADLATAKLKTVSTGSTTTGLNER